jgi:ABC-type dipeptide/oligopeptide/nickel transport system permease component
VVVNLIADLLSPLLDPRVRLGGGRREVATP